jgi:hypothetical protein
MSNELRVSHMGGEFKEELKEKRRKTREEGGGSRRK